MKKIIVPLILGVTLPLWLSVSVSAQGGTDVRLSIMPTLCIVDVVQDGNNQTLRTPSPDCEAALPILLAEPARAYNQASPLFALPFAGREPSVQQPLLRPQVEGSLTAIASRGNQMARSSSSRSLAPIITGIGLAIAVVAVGIDMALFELHYSRSIGRWTHKQTAGRILKK